MVKYPFSSVECFSCGGRISAKNIRQICGSREEALQLMTEIRMEKSGERDLSRTPL
jgi:hypothetical protein